MILNFKTLRIISHTSLFWENTHHILLSNPSYLKCYSYQFKEQFQCRVRTALSSLFWSDERFNGKKEIIIKFKWKFKRVKTFKDLQLHWKEFSCKLYFLHLIPWRQKITTIKNFSQTSVQRPPWGPKTSGRCWEMVVVQGWLVIKVQNGTSKWWSLFGSGL